MAAESPANIVAERALLSALFLDPARWDELTSDISEGSFTNTAHVSIFRAMREARKSGLDLSPATILTELERVDDDWLWLKQGGIARTLANLTVSGIPSRAGPSYARLVKEAEHKRAILKAAAELQAAATNGASAEDLARMFRSYSKKMEGVLAAAAGIRAIDIAAALSGEVPPVPWIASGWLGEGDVVIFGGEWATGKSLIALDLSLSVASGLPWMGKIPVERPGPVLYVDEENNARNVNRRVARMIRGREIDPKTADQLPLTYLTKNNFRLDTPRGLSGVRSEMDARRPTLVILDSLIRFHGGEENSNSDNAAFFGEAITPLATAYNCAFVILDHMRKPGKDDELHDTGHRIRGAGDKSGVADGVWTVEGDRETNSRTFSCRKNRWEDSLPPQLTTQWEVSDDDTAAWINCSDAVLGAEVTILRLLGDAPSGLLATALFEGCKARGVPARTATRAAVKMRERGAIEYRREPGRRVRYWVGQLVPPEI